MTTDLQVVSDAAGRMRVKVPWVRANSRRAVAVEEAVDRQHGVRAVHAYPHTGSVVVWYSPRRCDRDRSSDSHRRRRTRCRRTDSGAHTAVLRHPQHRSTAHGDRRRGPRPARHPSLWVQPPPAARSVRPTGRYRRDDFHGLPVPARRAARAARRARGHRRAGDRRDRRQPGAARERRRAHRAVAAEYR